MTGAAHLASAAAQRAGSGYVSLSSPGVDPTAPPEVVRARLPAAGWSAAVLEDLHRFHALVLGPGLGREPSTVAAARATIAAAAVPVVVDGDGLFALAGAAGSVRERGSPTVLTPHDGEYARLTGTTPDPDRLDAARQLATTTGAVVLLKGPTTVVADPVGSIRVVTTGDQRLATAGTGDVLSGIIAALLASGIDSFDAAAAGAWVHGAAASIQRAASLVASDVLDGIGTAIP
jgi:NAD(P)H-hydrate epimerase